jgi:hypothetical protein
MVFESDLPKGFVSLLATFRVFEYVRFKLCFSDAESVNDFETGLGSLERALDILEYAEVLGLGSRERAAEMR